MNAPGLFASFDEFYWCENRKLFHFFRRRLGHEEASDLTQEAFKRQNIASSCSSLWDRKANTSIQSRSSQFSTLSKWLSQSGDRKFDMAAN